MEDRFKILKVLSTVLKVTAWGILLVLAIGLVGLFVGAKAQELPAAQIAVNMVIGSILTFLVLYAVSEIIRILLVIEEQTRRS